MLSHMNSPSLSLTGTSDHLKIRHPYRGPPMTLANMRENGVQGAANFVTD
jgi:hypothetical protein